MLCYSTFLFDTFYIVQLRRKTICIFSIFDASIKIINQNIRVGAYVIIWS